MGHLHMTSTKWSVAATDACFLQCSWSPNTLSTATSS